MTSIQPSPVQATDRLPRSYWQLWTLSLLTALGGFIVLFLTPYLTESLGHSPVFAGLAITCFGAGTLAAPLGGILADRFGPRPIMLTAQLPSAAALLALGHVRHPWLIVTCAGLAGLTTSTARAARTAMITNIVPAAQRLKAFSYTYWATNIGYGVAPLATGVLIDHHSAWLFTGSAAITAACALFGYRIPQGHPPPMPDAAAAASAVHRPAQPGQAAPPDPSALPRRSPAAWRCGSLPYALIGSFLVCLLFKQASVTLPVSLQADGLSSTVYGTTLAVNGVLIIALQVPLTRWLTGKNENRILAVAGALVGLGFGLTALADTASTYTLTVVVWTVGEMLYTPAFATLTARLTPDGRHGYYQGIAASTTSAAGLIAPATAGLALTAVGLIPWWGLCTALGALSAVLFLKASQRSAHSSSLTQTAE